METESETVFKLLHSPFSTFAGQPKAEVPAGAQQRQSVWPFPGCSALPGLPLLELCFLPPAPAWAAPPTALVARQVGPPTNLWKEVGSCRAPQHEPRRLRMKNYCTAHTEAV